MTSMDNDDRQGRTTDNDTRYCGFRVGQHVVLVDDSGWAEYFQKYPQMRFLKTPSKGIVYTVRSVFICPYYGFPVLHLAEIINPPHTWPNGHWETGWGAVRFRPLQKLKIEDFIQTRVPAPEKREGVSVL